ncbi:MAG: LysR family transcriptional regulator [Gammaproteobacteria bacterium]
MFDLNEVRMFVQVIRAGSFAEAGRRLGVPPNTLSRRIRQLESSLDTRLMQRSTRKLTLTAAGNAFFERCAPAVDGVLNAGKALADGSHTPAGMVRIAAPADFLDFFEVEWVSQFLSAHPKVRLDFVLSDARADLIEEAIDVAFRAGTVSDRSPVFRQLMSQSFKLVASPAYLTLRGNPSTLQELSRHDCLIASGRTSPATWMLRGPNGSEEAKVSGRFSANSARLLLKGCLSGLGIALLPNVLIAPHLLSARLVHVLPGYTREGADLNVVLPSSQQIPTAVSAFVDFATDKFRIMIGTPRSIAAPNRAAKRPPNPANKRRRR